MARQLGRSDGREVGTRTTESLPRTAASTFLAAYVSSSSLDASALIAGKSEGDVGSRSRRVGATARPQASDGCKGAERSFGVSHARGGELSKVAKRDLIR